ncbi:MAG: VOC family protein [Candidatus Eremiobacteraeota bacterium]|nr:VOC family protein [Candidatus Eremiobacteraeota bacterium]
MQNDSPAITVTVVPKGYHSVSPYLLVDDVPALISFLQATFDAVEIERLQRPDGSVGHAEVKIGDSIVMMGGGQTMPTHLYVYVADVDATHARGLAAGATSVRAPEVQFYGDRVGAVKDPFGNTWWIATHVEDVTPAEIQRRAREQR